jgi:hypothetical protein
MARLAEAAAAAPTVSAGGSPEVKGVTARATPPAVEGFPTPA